MSADPAPAAAAATAEPTPEQQDADTAAAAAVIEEERRKEAATDAAAEHGTKTEEDTYGYYHLDDLDLPPLRIHATRVRDRLSASSLQIPPGLNQHHQLQKRYSLDSKVTHTSGSSPGSLFGGATSSSAASSISTSTGFRGGPRSRSQSPSLRSAKERATYATSAATSNLTSDGNSSFSSLEEFVDPDILYDKMGFAGELDMKDPKNKQLHQHSHSYTFGENTKTITLMPVSERMSEDTLEDVHAFSDLSANTNTRPSSSVGGSTVAGEASSHVLEPLYEGDDDDIESEAEDEGGENKEPYLHPVPGVTPQVIVTNMENITLQENHSS